MSDTRSRTEHLLELSLRLSSASTLTEVSDAVMAGTRSTFPEQAGAIVARLSSRPGELEIFAVSELPGQIFEDWQRFPIDTDAPLAECVRTGEVIALASAEAWQSRYPHLMQLVADTGHRAQLIVPLIAGGATIGCLGVAFFHDREFCPDDVQLLTAVASQCAVAMERARLYEREKEARETAEGASRAKSTFLAALSHELRTPLNAIGGYAELIEIGVHGPVTTEQSDALRRIQSSQKHLQRLINSVLELSRVEAGMTLYDLGRLEVQSCIAACESLTLPQMQQKHLRYERRGNTEPVVVLADGEKLTQIVVNLLANSIKYTPDEGSVILEVGHDDEYGWISVSDTGVGIDAAQLERIFEPFVRVQNHGAISDGAGLGLPISRSLARGMGGELSAESTVGEGSKFTLRIPLADTISPPD